MTRISRWFPPLTLALAGLLLVWQGLAGSPFDLVLGLVALFLAWWWSPLRGRGPTHRSVTADAGRHRVVIYWRPGCAWCARLRTSLGRLRRATTWVSIWADEEAAAFVRSVNDGNETVPTVVIDGQVHTNPDPQLVRAALADGGSGSGGGRVQ